MRGMTALRGLVDAHLHLQDPDLAPHLDGVLARAAAAGVEVLVTNGTSEEDWPAVLDLARRLPAVAPFFGLHPWYSGGRSARWLESLERHLATVPSGVGEIGLDRWKKGLDERAQEEVFRAQLGLARRLRRPASVHCVQAWGWLLDVLASEPPLQAGFLVHAFGGSVELIPRLADLGAMFSFAGDTLEERKAGKREAARAVPIDRILVETDAPDMLPPPPHRLSSIRNVRGKERNEPANLPEVLRGLAALRGEPVERLAEATAANARRLLGDIIPARREAP